MDIHLQTSFLAAIVTAGVAVGVALRARERNLSLLFGVFAGTLGFWFLSDLLLGFSGSPLFERLRLAVACAIPLATHQFFRAFLSSQTAGMEIESSEIAAQRLRGALVFGTSLGVLFSLTPLAHHSALKGVVFGYVFLALAAVLWQIHQSRTATPSLIERGRLAYLVLGGLAAAGCAVAGFIPGLPAVVPSVGKAVVVLYLYLLSQAILRHRLLDLNELLAKLVVLCTLALLLGFVYGVIVLLAGNDPALIVFNVSLISLALMTLFEPLRARFEHHVMGIVFSERILLQRVLQSLQREVPLIIDPVACAEHILDRLYETGRATHASVYLLSENGTGFKRIGHRGPEPPKWLEATLVREVVCTAEAGQKAVLRETVERRLQQSTSFLPDPTDDETPEATFTDEAARLRELHECLEKLSSGVLVPLMSGANVVGLLSLYDERVYEAYSTNEIKALVVVGQLAGTVVENSKLYERMKERDRLAALGEMAAGLAHEIRNPLGAIKAAAQYLRPAASPDHSYSSAEGAGGLEQNQLDPNDCGDAAEFLQVIVEEVDRLNGVVTQFLDYARPLKASFIKTDLREVVKRTLRLLEQKDISGEIETVQRLADDVPPVDADPEQIRQVLINLMLNSVQAMSGKGTLTVTVGVDDKQGSGSPSVHSVFVAVSDDGPGIPEHMRPHLFVPFFTSKERGTGLGLPICQRIVENHSGRIDVHSEPGQGAEIRIWLPSGQGESIQSPQEIEQAS